LLLIFNFETKFILRISGMPRMGIVRKFLWKLASKKIHLITCPTNNTMNFIKNLNIIDSNKIMKVSLQKAVVYFFIIVFVILIIISLLI